MAYEQPTLFGVAYASRLSRGLDYESSYEELVDKTAPQLDLAKAGHTSELLTWLNRWGCRINKRRFRRLGFRLEKWFSGQSLPPITKDIARLKGSDLDQLRAAYEGLIEVGLGPTAAAKALFALRPSCAIPWDKPIRDGFELGSDGAGYRRLLELSCREAKGLAVDAEQYGVTEVVRVVNASLPIRPNSQVRLTREELKVALISAPVCWTYSSSKRPRLLFLSADYKSTTSATARFAFDQVATMLTKAKVTRSYTYWKLSPAADCGSTDTGGGGATAKTARSLRLMTLAKLLDEYHWITVTVGHQIPTAEHLVQWASWRPKN